MLVRDVFVATGGPRGLFKPKVGEVYQVSATCAIFVPVMMPEGERDPEHRDMEWQVYREVRPQRVDVTVAEDLRGIRRWCEQGPGIVHVRGIEPRPVATVGYDDPTGDDVAADWRRS